MKLLAGPAADLKGVMCLSSVCAAANVRSAISDRPHRLSGVPLP
jgi:hypothetical protein